MSKIYILILFFCSPLLFAQNEWVKITEESGIVFYYTVQDCDGSDKVLIRIQNTLDHNALIQVEVTINGGTAVVDASDSPYEVALMADEIVEGQCDNNAALTFTSYDGLSADSFTIKTTMI